MTIESSAIILTVVKVAWLANVVAAVVAYRCGPVYDYRLQHMGWGIRTMYCVGFFGPEDGRRLKRLADRAALFLNAAMAAQILFFFACLFGDNSMGSNLGLSAFGACCIALVWPCLLVGLRHASGAWELEQTLVAGLGDDRRQDLTEFRGNIPV